MAAKIHKGIYKPILNSNNKLKGLKSGLEWRRLNNSQSKGRLKSVLPVLLEAKLVLSNNSRRMSDDQI